MTSSDRHFTIFTIGHSTRPVAEFADLLLAHGIGLVADVRTIPRSRHNPQYNSDELAAALQEHGIAYEHIPGLGGLRHTRKDSINTGWENASFRGYADYMQTTEFAESLDRLIGAARERATVIMCAEAVPWRCHRGLIGDALVARGIKVIDIISRTSAREHSLTAWAKVEGTRVTYPATPNAKSAARHSHAK